MKLGKSGIEVNSKLQTTNPRIYACGDVIGGYQFTHVASYQANVVLKNALFLPVFKADYRVIPWAIFTDPELARVGLTEQEARERYGNDINVVKQEFAEVDRSSRSCDRGICKDYYPTEWSNSRGSFSWSIRWGINSRNYSGNVS